VAIVNDLPIALEALRRAVAQYPGATIAWSAMDGEEAVRQCRADRPDMILMDLIMPKMDGVEATRRIMRDTPCPILVVTATVTGNAARVFEALGAGALDAIDTPNLSSPDGLERLCRRMQHIARLSKDERAPTKQGTTITATTQHARGTTPLLLVGSSTGGPQALCTLLTSLPKPPPCAVLIVQHLDAGFIPGLVEWLAKETGHDVRLAQAGNEPGPGAIWVAGGSQHLVLEASGKTSNRPAQPHELHHPSVDMLFDSAAKSKVAPGVAVLLTGMGRDGAEGLLALRNAGWHTIAQDQATSVVWGMPGATANAGNASEILPLDGVARKIIRLVERAR
jgi:two-component system response regulator WspF